jgi:hypothetical protein
MDRKSWGLRQYAEKSLLQGFLLISILMSSLIPLGRP